MLSTVLALGFLTIHTLALNLEKQRGRARLKSHRVSVHAQFLKRGASTAVADRLHQHMSTYRLSMWAPEDPKSIEDDYIVRMDENCGVPANVHMQTVEENIKTQNDNQDREDYEGVVEHEFSALHGFSAHLSPTALSDILDDPCVQYVEQNHVIELDPKENETQGGGVLALGATQDQQVTWGLDQIDGTEDGQYRYENDGTGVYIYILDTGVQITHQEFVTEDGIVRAIAGADYTHENSCNGQATECNFPGQPGCTCGTIPAGNAHCSGHGTHCGGTAAGRYVGVAKGATIVAVRVLSCSGSGSYAGVLAGMDYVVRMKLEKHPDSATVMSMSLGGPRPQESYDDPSHDMLYGGIMSAKEAGIAVVVAAGNSAVDTDTQSPAHVDDAITVCASTQEKDRAYFSCFGEGIDLCAPGYQVRSAVTGNDDAYDEYSGTSMATPHVAGVLALMLQHNSDWSVEQVTNELLTDCVEEDTITMVSESSNIADWERDLIMSTPNKLTNLFGKTGQCAAATEGGDGGGDGGGGKGGKGGKGRRGGASFVGNPPQPKPNSQPEPQPEPKPEPTLQTRLINYPPGSTSGASSSSFLSKRVLPGDEAIRSNIFMQDAQMCSKNDAPLLEEDEELV